MNADKLNEAAEEYNNLYVSSNIPAFKSGADWLMQQPLSDRLTDEEKERIRHCMSEALRQKNNKSIHYVINERNRIQSDAIIVTLKYIFGEELFNEK